LEKSKVRSTSNKSGGSEREARELNKDGWERMPVRAGAGRTRITW